MAREHDRHSPFLQAKVFGLKDDLVLSCQIAEISEKGAILLLPDSDAPLEFVLTIPARGESFYCERVRREGDLVRVRFVVGSTQK